MRKLIALLGLLLVLAAPVAAAAPKGAASVAYMPINSLSGLFGAKVDFRPNTGNDIITLSFANGKQGTINVRTNVVIYNGTSRTLTHAVMRKGANVFVPIVELGTIFTDVGAKVPPGKAAPGKPQGGTSPTVPVTSTVSFTRLPNADTIYGTLQTQQPAVIMGKANKVLNTLGGINPNSDVLIVYRGQFSTGGYAIEVQSLTVVNGVLHIGAKLTNPAAGSIVTPALSYPYDVVVLGTHAQFTTWQMSLGGSQPATGTVIQVP